MDINKKMMRYLMKTKRSHEMDINQKVLKQKIVEYLAEIETDSFTSEDIELLYLTCCNFPGIDSLISSAMVNNESGILGDLIANASACLFGGCRGFSDQCKPENEKLDSDILEILDNALYQAIKKANKDYRRVANG